MKAKHLAEQLKLDNRIEQAAEQKAFITFTDHKPNFPNNTKCKIIVTANLLISLSLFFCCRNLLHPGDELNSTCVRDWLLLFVVIICATGSSQIW